MESAANSPAVRSGLKVRSSRNRSRATNGSLFVEVDGRGAWARRWRDIIAELTADAGGGDLLGEARKQLIKRAATIAVACEKLEQKALTAGRSIFEDTPGDNGSGPSSLTILQEAARILHALARRNMHGTTTAALIDLPPAEQDRVADLLVKASDIASKAHIAAGSNIDLELYGSLVGHLNRVLARLGLERRAKDVTDLSDHIAKIEADNVEREAEREEAEAVS